MSGWRPSSKKPRNGQRVVVAYLDRLDFEQGAYRLTETFQSDDGWRHPWSFVRSWIPERELIRQAREAGKKVK
jgi:hypothetical protein